MLFIFLAGYLAFALRARTSANGLKLKRTNSPILQFVPSFSKAKYLPEIRIRMLSIQTSYLFTTYPMTEWWLRRAAKRNAIPRDAARLVEARFVRAGAFHKFVRSIAAFAIVFHRFFLRPAYRPYQELQRFNADGGAKFDLARPRFKTFAEHVSLQPRRVDETRMREFVHMHELELV